jgi:hypothetical protein
LNFIENEESLADRRGCEVVVVSKGDNGGLYDGSRGSLVGETTVVVESVGQNQIMWGDELAEVGI